MADLIQLHGMPAPNNQYMVGWPRPWPYLGAGLEQGSRPDRHMLVDQAQHVNGTSQPTHSVSYYSCGLMLLVCMGTRLQNG